MLLPWMFLFSAIVKNKGRHCALNSGTRFNSPPLSLSLSLTDLKTDVSDSI